MSQPAMAEIPVVGSVLDATPASPAEADTSLAETNASPQLCDQLAAEPGAVTGLAGIALDQIDPMKAAAACAAALDAQPGDARLSYQLGRALERLGRIQDAHKLYDWAASDSYAPAIAGLDRLASIMQPQQPGPSTEARKQASDFYAGLAAGLRRYATSVPIDPTDPVAKVAELGTDPDAALNWVTQSTRLVPYRGALRGARGVLLDHAGNSLDRSLLLATLLQNGGQDVRLARTTLSDEQSRALLAAAAAMPAPAPEIELRAGEVLAFFKDDPRLDMAALQQAAEATDQDQQRVHDTVTASQPQLIDAVWKAAALSGETVNATSATAAALLADHFWVQQRTAEGWRDMDPDAAIVGTLTPVETLDPAKLPGELLHRVTLRVVLELQDEHGRHEAKLLEWSGEPAKLIDTPISIVHASNTMGTTAQLVGVSEPMARMLETVDLTSWWTPVLKVSGQFIVDQMFTADGQVRAGSLDAMAQLGGGIGSSMKLMTEALDSGGVPAAKPAIPTAEWIEIQIDAPGRAPVIQRRTLFDLIGPAVRATPKLATINQDALRDRALHLIGATDITIAGAAPSRRQVERIAARDLGTIIDNLRKLLSIPEDELLDNLPTSPDFPLPLYDFASRRFTSAAAQTAANVFLLHERFAWRAGQGVIRQMEFDIVANDAMAAADPLKSAVSQGVRDTVLEGALFDGAGDTQNAASLHAADIAAGRPWTRVDPADTSRLYQAGVPADFRARIETDLNNKLIVVARTDMSGSTAGQLAWWRIDPVTGVTLGMLPDGGGATAVETAMHYYHMLHEAACGFTAISVVLAGGAEAMSNTALALCIVATGGGSVGAAAGLVGTVIHAIEIYHAATGH